jgi:cholesterol transport system auxiliary component
MTKIPMPMSKECPNEQMTQPAARSRFWPFALWALGSVALCGCGSEPVWKSQSFAFARPPDPPAAAVSKTNVVALRRVSISPLFQGRSFTYRMAENSYEHDPYAGFFVSPERAIEHPVRAWLRDGGAFGSVIGPASALNPSMVAEVSVIELYGDFRKKARPVGVLKIHFLLYEVNKDGPGRVLMDKVCTAQTPMAKAAPAALAAAWDADIAEIMAEINSELKRLPLN